jgi:hypothetical protein
MLGEIPFLIGSVILAVSYLRRLFRNWKSPASAIHSVA